MTLDPKLVILPWNPVKGSSVETQFSVLGGASPYKWSSTNSNLGAVSQAGSARVETSLIGSTNISAFMTRATHNKAQGEIRVEPAEKLAFVPSEREFLVGTELVLPLAIYSKNGALVSRCDGL